MLLLPWDHQLDLLLDHLLLDLDLMVVVVASYARASSALGRE
jgi:hypothetical protein